MSETNLPETVLPDSAPNRVLVKLRPSTPLGVAERRAGLRLLFDHPVASGRFGAEETAQWFLVDLPDAPTAASPWDFAHAQVADQLGVDEDDVLFAEPDLLHREAFRVDEAGAIGDCTALPQDTGHGKAARPGEFGWHLGRDFSQLAAARDHLGGPDLAVRIGHLDTGYDAHHETVPRRLRRDLGRSFVDTDWFRGSADRDDRGFLFDNSGHGTGTLGILAGGLVTEAGVVLGGAPEAEVVPVRISDSVVLLRTSALAEGLQYALEVGCDVVSLCMGGLPSKVWGETVDRAYDAGLSICAAAGNHIGPTPPKRVVYPARFPRVIAVCGVMADGRPYADLQGFVLEGSFGPPSAMGQAIAAYTPNIPWPRHGCARSTIRHNGEGTSAATPQVAAAAALWLAQHQSRLPRDWRRVEAVRHALFSTASDVDRTHFGRGILRARAALDVLPDLNRPASKASEVHFLLFRPMIGVGLAEVPTREQMFNLELEQRWLLYPELQAIVPDPERSQPLTESQLRRFMTAVIEDRGASAALRKHVAARYPAATKQSASTSVHRST